MSDADSYIDECPDVICMFNVFYCFQNQAKALTALLKLARPHTRMIIFDHIDRGGYKDNPLMDAGELFLPNPLRLDEVKENLKSTGWQVPKLRELNEQYVAWYASLVERIERARDKITDMAEEHGYNHVLRLYRGLLNAAQQSKLGAAIVTTAPAS